MDLDNKLIVKFFIIMWNVLIHAHPSQTTLFNDIFWASKSTISTGTLEIPYRLIHSSEGDVGAGNYTNYTLKWPGTLRFVLKPIMGDPDLYISEGGHSNPTFMPEDYAYSSATCGDERIDIKSSFKRPVNIAVYGHPFYETSKYSLEILIAEFEEPDPFVRGDINEFEHNDDTKPEGSDSPHNDYETAMSWVSVSWEIIRSILEILIEVMM